MPAYGVATCSADSSTNMKPPEFANPTGAFTRSSCKSDDPARASFCTLRPGGQQILLDDPSGNPIELF
jgi:hypothetical protein